VEEFSQVVVGRVVPGRVQGNGAAVALLEKKVKKRVKKGVLEG
jgi:hypothetical protein